MYKKPSLIKVTKNALGQWQGKCAGFIFFFSANVAHADVDTFVRRVNQYIINPIILVIFFLAAVYFLYGVFEFMSNQESEDKKTSGKRHMIWGLVGIVIMMGVFALLNILMDTFGITGVNPQTGDVNLPPF